MQAGRDSSSQPQRGNFCVAWNGFSCNANSSPLQSFSKKIALNNVFFCAGLGGGGIGEYWCLGRGPGDIVRSPFTIHRPRLLGFINLKIRFVRRRQLAPYESLGITQFCHYMMCTRRYVEVIPVTHSIRDYKHIRQLCSPLWLVVVAETINVTAQY